MVHGDKACAVAGVIDLGRIAACRLNSPGGMEQRLGVKKSLIKTLCDVLFFQQKTKAKF